MSLSEPALPNWSGALDGPRYKRFRELTSAALAPFAHVTEPEIDSGTILCGADTKIHLVKLVCSVARLPDDAWPDAIGTFMLAAFTTPPTFGREELRRILKLQIRYVDSENPDDGYLGPTFASDLKAAYVLECGTMLRAATSDDLALIGESELERFAFALGNIMAETRPKTEIVDVDFGRLTVVESSSFFVATQILAFHEFSEIDDPGALVIIPTATFMAYLPIAQDGADLGTAIVRLAEIGASAAVESQHTCSPSVYWCSREAIERIPVIFTAKAAIVTPSEALRAILAEYA
jgi:hypothetical protein